jgi:hypothetical protein
MKKKKSFGQSHLSAAQGGKNKRGQRTLFVENGFCSLLRHEN